MIDKNTLSKYPRPDWLPNWKDPSAYPDHGNSGSAWAWEFLRRNPEYQADYANFMAIPNSIIDFDGQPIKSPKWHRDTYEPDADMRFYYAPSGAVKPEETVAGYEARTGVEPVRMETWLLRKWGLVTLNDPAKDEPVFFAPDSDMPPFELSQTSFSHTFREHIGTQGSVALPREIPGREMIVATWQEEDDGYLVPIAFDIRYPLDGQLAAAKAMLEEARSRGDPNSSMPYFMGDPDPVKLERGPSTRFDKLRDYLRVFDAAWTVGWDKRQEIAADIWPDKKRDNRGDHSGLKTADDAMSKAVEFVSQDWLKLLKWAGLPRNIKK